MMGGYVMQLQNFSVNDGEGIRTTVFLASCPLRCAWCANPEGQTVSNPMVRWMEKEEVLQEIQRQEIFYRFSGGGITFSGGEATAQPEFLKELVDNLYDEGYSLALETCGQFDFERLRPVLKKMDLIFMDLKHIDPEEHRRFTGVDNRLILENLQRTADLGVPLVVRIPTIRGVNSERSLMERCFAFLRERVPGAKVEFLPYHRFGEGKYLELGLEPPGEDFSAPSENELDEWKALAKDYGLALVSYR